MARSDMSGLHSAEGRSEVLGDATTELPSSTQPRTTLPSHLLQHPLPEHLVRSGNIQTEKLRIDKFRLGNLDSAAP